MPSQKMSDHYDESGRTTASECHQCSKAPDWRGLQRHHIKHRSQGGTDEPGNLVLLCGHCHDAAHGIRDIESQPMWSKCLVS